mgnify:CR=1 FL=1
MKKHLISLVTIMTLNSLQAQQPLTPEKLWQLHRVSAVGLSQDTQYVLLSVSTPNMAENTFSKEYYKLAVKGGVPIPISEEEVERATAKYNPIKKESLVKLIHKEVKVDPVLGKDFYPDLEKSSGRLYSSLDHRHWDMWNEGKYNHVFMEDAKGNQKDLMEGQPFYCPQVPFGGDEDYIWSPDGEKVLYVTKAKVGTEYVLSTNTDIYEYDLNTMKTRNLTEGMMGYDTNPQYSKEGVLAWLSMAHDGNESDKNDLYILKDGKRINLTAQWDNTVFSYRWSNDGKQIYLIAPTQGTEQLFVVDVYGKDTTPKQLTKGIYDVGSIVGQSGNLLVVMCNDMNRAGEVYTINLKERKKGFLSLTQLSHFNDEAYKSIATCPIKERIIKTTDGKDMHAWVIYPPDFDPNKKYPTLLYCQGGPQSIVSQFYSFRWNFQLMASQGYIVIAPNRRGLPGFGVEWNAQISGDWGGQPMRDYLSAIDDIAKATSNITGIPSEKLQKSEQRMLVNLEKHLGKYLIGQNDAVAKVANSIRLSRSGIANSSRPMGSFVFMGPTGVGKTELARVLAREIFGSNDNLVKIDMSEFSEKHTASRLIGAPAGYIGYDDGGQLTDKIRRQPYSVVLFDEIEKAHPSIFHLLLQLLEDGTITDGQGRSVDFTNTIVILTSNLGAEAMQKESELGFMIVNAKDRRQFDDVHKHNAEAARAALDEFMPPELINRFDSIITFRALERKQVNQIVDLFINDLKDRLSRKGISLVLSPSAKKILINKGYSKKYGVRPLRRTIEDIIEYPIAEGIIKGDFVAGTIITVYSKRGNICMKGGYESDEKS